MSSNTQGCHDHPGLGAQRHWLSVQASELIDSQQVIQVDSQATVQQACDALITHGIQSVPLWDSKTSTYTGMFDLHDLASYLLLHYRKKLQASKSPAGSQSRGSPSGSSVRSEETASPLARRVAMNVGEPVANVSDMSQNNPFYSVLPETTVAQVAGVFARGTHRLAVMQPGGVEIRGILSQTRVVRYFFEHCAVTGPSGENNGSKAYISEAETQLLDRTLGDLGLVSGNHVVSAKPTMPVIQALSLLEEHHVSSLPLVDEQMRVVGNFSVADAKYLARERKLVDATCMELIQAVRFMQGVNEGQDRAAVFAVRPQATLRHALAKLVATGAHRLWITQPQDDDGSGGLAVDGAAGLAGVRNRRASVSSTSSQTVGIAPAHYGGAFDDKLCGVVSLTDIMRLLIQAAPSPPQNPEYDYASMD